MKFADGYISFRDYRTYYKIFGKASAKTPVLVLHGGPGSTHNYMLGLAGLSTDRQVVFYDQLGGGLSDKPTEDIWSLALFIEELSTLRNALGLDKIILIGHSWGGMLAIEHVLADQSGITGLVLASSMISMPLYQTEVDILRSQLPKTVQATLRRHEKAGTTDSTEYTSAMQQYNKRHLYRGTNYPDAYRAPKGSFCEASYIKLWGQSEAYPDGNLRHWDRSNDLHAIAVPTLITSGQYDELTPAQAVFTHDNIPGSKLAIFTGASHLAHIEREKDYMQTVAEFLKAL